MRIIAFFRDGEGIFVNRSGTHHPSILVRQDSNPASKIFFCQICITKKQLEVLHLRMWVIITGLV